MEDLISRAWKNLNEDSKEIEEKTIVNPTKVGEVYPLAIKNLMDGNRLGVYLGELQLYKNSKKKKLFCTKEKVMGQENYHLYNSKEDLLWYSEGEDGPEWPAGISAEFIDIANEKNEKEIEKRFGRILEEIRISGVNKI